MLRRKLKTETSAEGLPEPGEGCELFLALSELSIQRSDLNILLIILCHVESQG